MIDSRTDLHTVAAVGGFVVAVGSQPSHQHSHSDDDDYNAGASGLLRPEPAELRATAIRTAALVIVQDHFDVEETSIVFCFPAFFSVGTVVSLV